LFSILATVWLAESKMSVSCSAKEMPPREALTETEKELTEAKEAALAAEAKWSEDLAAIAARANASSPRRRPGPPL
jgi:hypothetical protein